MKGYPLHIVTSDAFAREKLDHMRILGATLADRAERQRTHDGEADARHDRGGARHRRGDRRLLDRSVEEHRPARRLSHAWRRRSGRRPDGRIDGFVQSVGTAASLRGTGGRPAPRTTRRSESLPSSRPNRRCCRAARRAPTRSTGSARASSCRSGSRTSPIGSSGSPPKTPSRWPCGSPARKAFSPGTSTGANVIAALRLAEQLGPDATVVTVMCDTGMKYLKNFGARLD